jgi:hypothetical protein
MSLQFYLELKRGAQILALAIAALFSINKCRSYSNVHEQISK